MPNFYFRALTSIGASTGTSEREAIQKLNDKEKGDEREEINGEKASMSQHDISLAR